MKPAVSHDTRGPALLVVQTSFLGDVVLTTPLVSALRRRLVPRRLALLVRPEAVPLVAGHPDIDQVLVDDKRGADRAPRRSTAGSYVKRRGPPPTCCRPVRVRCSVWRPARRGPPSAGRLRASRP